jgi:hypothetical protein
VRVARERATEKTKEKKAANEKWWQKIFFVSLLLRNGAKKFVFFRCVPSKSSLETTNSDFMKKIIRLEAEKLFFFKDTREPNEVG